MSLALLAILAGLLLGALLVGHWTPAGARCSCSGGTVSTFEAPNWLRAQLARRQLSACRRAELARAWAR